MPRIPAIFVGLAVVSVAFGAIEARWPAIRGQRFLRRGVRTDLVYWFFTPLVSGALARGAVVVAAVCVAAAAGAELDGAAIRRFYDARIAASPVARWPVWLQAIGVLGLVDLAGYFMHRAFHRGRLWRIHAVHHASTELDWLSAVRVHPLNAVGMRVAQALPLLLLGFDARVVAASVPLLTLYGIFVHANVAWSFGPLRFVVATPCFHRWHHTAEAEGLDKNFAGLFPVWDLVFGTFHMPRGRKPERFGAPGHEVPDAFLGQMTYPLRRHAAPRGA